MEIIKIKSNYKNSTLLRLAKKYTVDKVNFDNYGAGGANDTVKDMYTLFYWMECVKGEIRFAKSCMDKKRIERVRAGEFNYIVNFKDKQLDSVQLVAVV